MATNKNTWRVCGIDPRCTKVCLQQVLRAIDASPRFEIQSLAMEHGGNDQTATVSFAAQARPYKLLRPCRDHPSRGKQQPTLDDDFLGFTTLFAPPERDHQIDVIAISGLGGHPFDSFEERGGEHMWLRDALPRDLVGARVMTYGCRSPVAESRSFQNVEDIVSNLCLALTAVVSRRYPRPILLISHGLGGLIVKEAIITLAASRRHEDEDRLLRAIYGLVFFGVPHLGMESKALITMASTGLNLEMITSFSQVGSHFLARQNRKFPGALEVLGGEVFCFYETQESPTARQTSGGWDMKGPRTVLVSRASATAGVAAADIRLYTCAINRPHSEIIKYSQRDETYKVVLSKLQILAKRAVRYAT